MAKEGQPNVREMCDGTSNCFSRGPKGQTPACKKRSASAYVECACTYRQTRGTEPRIFRYLDTLPAHVAARAKNYGVRYCLSIFSCTLLLACARDLCGMHVFHPPHRRVGIDLLRCHPSDQMRPLFDEQRTPSFRTAAASGVNGRVYGN
jgi:hypothetical protein